MPRELIDLTQKTFGKLIVIRLLEILRTNGESRPYWMCKCSCGKHVRVRGDVLRDGRKTDCGCKTTKQHFCKSMLEVNGEKRTVEQWARFYGILPSHIYDRLRCGLSAEQAVTIPVGRQGVRIRQNKKRRLQNAQ